MLFYVSATSQCNKPKKKIQHIGEDLTVAPNIFLRYL